MIVGLPRNGLGMHPIRSFILRVLGFQSTAPILRHRYAKFSTNCSAVDYAKRRQCLVDLMRRENVEGNFRKSASQSILSSFVCKTRTAEKFICLVGSGRATYLAPGVVNRFKPHGDYTYLAGMEEPDCWLMIEGSLTAPSDGHMSTVFVKQRNEAELRFDGELETPELARKLGIDRVKSLEDLTAFIQSIQDSVIVFASGDLPGPQLSVKTEHASPFIHALRAQKDGYEIEQVKRSCDIIVDCLSTDIFPGRFDTETDLEIALDHGLRRRGTHRSFAPVIGCGPNVAKAIHYQRNNQPMMSKHLVLVDAGCEFNRYCSDISRTFPCIPNESWTIQQSIIYDIVLDVQQSLIQALATNATDLSLEHLYAHMIKMLARHLKNEKIVVSADNVLEEVAKEFCPHDVGHHLGIDVHDCPEYPKSSRFQTNNVITIEPGLYFRPGCRNIRPEFQGISIRIEDVIAIGSGGTTVLTEKCPKTRELLRAARLTV